MYASLIYASLSVWGSQPDRSPPYGSLIHSWMIEVVDISELVGDAGKPARLAREKFHPPTDGHHGLDGLVSLLHHHRKDSALLATQERMRRLIINRNAGTIAPH